MTPEELNDKLGFPISIWRVTTEGDCEGRTSIDLGIYYGHIAEIAFYLRNKTHYCLNFTHLPTIDTRAKNVKDLLKKDLAKPFESFAHISFNVFGLFSDIDAGRRITLLQEWLDQASSDISINLENGKYYSATGAALINQKKLGTNLKLVSLKEMNYHQQIVTALQREIKSGKDEIAIKERELKKHKAFIKSFPKARLYERLGTIPAIEIMPLIPSERIPVLGTSVRCKSLRLQTFKKNPKCVSCGIEGTFFAAERAGTQEGYHINFYAQDEYGNDVLMTRDHIQPLSKDGPDTLDNSQTMCYICNELKGNQE